jgi:hypothetical protein
MPILEFRIARDIDYKSIDFFNRLLNAKNNKSM